jgi:hypothetical protein
MHAQYNTGFCKFRNLLLHLVVQVQSLNDASAILEISIQKGILDSNTFFRIVSDT